MLDKYQIITLTHQRLPLQKMGDYVVPATEATPLSVQLAEIKKALHLDELLYLSTCNRLMFLFSKAEPLSPDFAERLFRQINPGLSEEQIELALNCVEIFDGTDAIRHLAEVASSVNSLVVGEREILRQLRQAYEQCRSWKLTGDDLRLTNRFAVETAKAVYAQTRIGEKPVSVVSLAIQELLKEQIDRSARILMIGAGQTNNLVGKFLIKHQFSNVTVFNRTPEKAQALADRFDGNGHPLSDLASYKQGFDVLIACTGAVRPIVDEATYRQLVGDDQAHKTIIDLSVPNNVSADVVQQYNCKYIGVDGLKELANNNLSFRRKEVVKANQLIESRLPVFQTLYKQRQIEKALAHIPEEIKTIKKHAVEVVFKKDLEKMDAATKDLIDRMLTYMERRCISVPMTSSRQSDLFG